MNEDRMIEQIMEAQYVQNNASRGKFKYLPEDPEYGPVLCDICDEKMPLPRREYGLSNCVTCATRLENERKQYGR